MINDTVIENTLILITYDVIHGINKNLLTHTVHSTQTIHLILLFYQMLYVLLKYNSILQTQVDCTRKHLWSTD